MEFVSTNSHETDKPFACSVSGTLPVERHCDNDSNLTLKSSLTVVFYRLNGPDHSKSDLQNTSPDGKRHSVGSIIGAELSDQILDMKVHGCLRDRKPIGNLLVAVSVSNELKYLQFAIR